MKRNLTISVIFFSLFVITGCGQKDPVGAVTGDTGSIFVISSEGGALIYLDGELREEVTPDTLKDIPAGDHVVTVCKNGFHSDPGMGTVTVVGGDVATVSFAMTPISIGAQRIVLLEDFSNTGCIPCVVSDSIVTEVLNSYGVTKVVGIQYHVFWPYPGDIFYLANRDDNNSRTSYYGVDGTGIPYVVLDGISTPAPADAVQLQQAIEERRMDEPLLEIDVQNVVNGSSGTVEVQIRGLSGICTGDFRVKVVLLEGSIQYNAPNGLDHFENVMRAMLPDPDGVAIHLTVGDTLSFRQSYTIDTEWNVQNLSVVAFVQDEGTRKVLQAASSFSP